MVMESRDCRTLLTRIATIILEYDPKLLPSIQKYQKLSTLLEAGILESPHDERLLLNLFKRLLEKSSHECLDLYSLIIENIFYNLWSKALSSQNRNDKFWTFVRDAYVSVYNLAWELNRANESNEQEMNDPAVAILKEKRRHLLGKIQNSLQKVFLDLIETVKMMNPQNREQELKFAEILTTLRTFLNASLQFVNAIATTKGFYEELVDKCLFTSLKDENKEPKCKIQESIHSALQMLAVLAKDPGIRLELSKFIIQLHLQGRWRKCTYQSWKVGRIKELNNVDYNGLKNLGCTCYMNSLLQQLFMIQSFRESILNAPDSKFKEFKLDDNVLFQLKCVFTGLIHSKKGYYTPRSLCMAFKEPDGMPTNLNEQKDVFEFYSIFMDKIEEQTKKTTYEHLVKNHFGGTVTREIICRGCPHSYEREEPFLAINLEVKNKKHIVEGLTSYVEGETLDGDNAYLCEKCNMKVKATMRTSVRKLPKYLMLVLKRFEFDFERGIKLKINEFCEFPLELDMHPFTYQAFHKQKKQQDASQLASSQSMTFKDHERESSKYSLRGVIIHVGVADSGHYYSLIKDKKDGEDRWLEFNDRLVTNFSINKLPNVAFGTKEGMNTFQNAYVLLYERIESLEEPLLKTTFSTRSLEVVTSPKKENSMIEESQQLLSQIDPEEIEAMKEFRHSLREKSRNYFTKKLLFNPDYSQFLIEILRDYKRDHFANAQNAPDGHRVFPETDFLVFEFLLTAFLTTVLRSSEKAPSYEFLKTLISIIEEDEKIAKYVLNIIKHRKFLREFILECSNEDVRKIMSTLIRKTFAANVNFERQLLITDENHIAEGNQEMVDTTHQPTGNGEQAVEGSKSPAMTAAKRDNLHIMKRLESSIIGELLDFILDSLPDFRCYHKNIGIHFQNIYRIIRESPYIGEYMLRKGIISKFINFLLDPEESTNSNNENKLDVEEVKSEPDNEITKNYYGWSNYDYSSDDLQKAMLPYFWMVLAYLVRRASKFYDNPLDGINYSIPAEQTECLFKDPKLIATLFRNAADKATVRLIVRLYCDLCYNNSKISRAVVSAIQQWEQDGEYEQIESWFELSRASLNIGDNHQRTRAAWILTMWSKLVKGLAERNFYFIAGCEWLYKMFTANSACLDVAREQTEFIGELKVILEQEYEPSDKNIRKKFQVRATGQQQIEYYINMKRRIKRLIKNFNKLMDPNENVDTNADEVNSQTQEGVTPVRAKKGDRLNYFDMTTKSWYVVEVITVLEELAEVKYINSQSHATEWIELDSGYVAAIENTTGTIQTTKNNQSDNQTQSSSETEEIGSTEGMVSENEADKGSQMMLSPETGNNTGNNTIEY